MSESIKLSWFIEDFEPDINSRNYSGVGITWKPTESRNRRYIYMTKAQALAFAAEVQKRFGVAP